MPHNIIKHYKTDNNYNINSGVTKILFMISEQKFNKHFVELKDRKRSFTLYVYVNISTKYSHSVNPKIK